MGSLSKIQIKEDTKTGQINWEYAAETIIKFIDFINFYTIPIKLYENKR